VFLEVCKSDGADEVTETEFKNAAWYYPQPKEKAKNIKDHVAFCEYFRFLYGARSFLSMPRTSQETGRSQNEIEKNLLGNIDPCVITTADI
jgi:hypothetical protein